MTKLVMADTRSENAEMDIGRLNVRIDKVDYHDGDDDHDHNNVSPVSHLIHYHDGDDGDHHYHDGDGYGDHYHHHWL